MIPIGSLFCKSINTALSIMCQLDDTSNYAGLSSSIIVGHPGGGKLESSKRTIIIAIAVVGILVTAGLVMLVGNKPASGENFNVTMTDALGRKVNLTHQPERIVSCAPEITELVYAMGQGSKLVGVTGYCDYPQDVVDRKAAQTVKDIGGFSTPKAEEIVDLTPDLVLVTASMSQHVELANQLEGLGLAVVALYEGATINRVYDNIRLVGSALKMEGQAASLVGEMQKKITAIQGKIDWAKPQAKVFFAVWLEPIYAAGAGTFINEVVQFAGGANAMASYPGWAMVSKEDVIAASPDIIFVSGTMMEMTPEQIITSMETDPVWSMTPAVQNHKVFVVTNQGENVFVRQSVRIVEAIQLMAEVLQPSAFGANVPNIIGSEYQDYLTPLTSSSGPTADLQSVALAVPIKWE